MIILNRIAVWRAGGRSVAITWDKPYPFEELDGLVIGGGDDISATLYVGELAVDVRVDPRRDKLEMKALETADNKGLPVLGICRGSQLMNVFYGGDLHSEIAEEFRNSQHIRTALPRKCVEITKGSRLEELIGDDHCYVNSLHHQAVRKLGDRFEISAKDEGGMIQATERPGGRFLVGVQ